MEHEPEPTATPDFVAILLRLINAAASTAVGLPVQVRFRAVPWRAAMGELDLVRIDLQGIVLGGIIAEKVKVRAHKVRFHPGLQPRITAGPIQVRAIVTQAELDKWTRRVRLPTRFMLRESGVTAVTSLAGYEMSEVEVEIRASGRFLQVRPRRTSVLGIPTPTLRVLRGFLPFPPMPYGMTVTEFHPKAGEIWVDFLIESIDQKLTPDIMKQVRKRIGFLPEK